MNKECNKSLFFKFHYHNYGHGKIITDAVNYIQQSIEKKSGYIYA